MERPGSKTNGHSSGGTTRGQPSSDIYKQLINNDMVKELDDIEAISQQIFQHAEVLHNSWKNNGVSQGPQFKLSTAQQQVSSPGLDHSLNLRERGVISFRFLLSAYFWLNCSLNLTTSWSEKKILLTMQLTSVTESKKEFWT